MSTIIAGRLSARFVKSVSVLAIGVALAGCASDTVRFSDGFYTGAVPKQPVAPVQTPFPQNQPVQTYNQPSAPVQAPQATAPRVDYTTTSAVSQNSTVQRQQLTAPSSMPVQTAQDAKTLSPIKEQAVKPEVMTSAATKAVKKAGWSAVGGTMVTVGANDSFSTLSKRYGVPANEIAKANGLSGSAILASGTRLIIPVYNSAGAPSTTAMSNAPIPGSRPAGTEVASLAPSIAATAAPKAPAAVTNTGKYVVAGGDTLSRIASQTGASVASIKRLNGLSSDNLQIGQTLLIPGYAGNPSAEKLAAKPTNVDPITTGNSTAATKKVVAYTPPKAKVETKGSISTIDSSSTASAPANTGVGSMRWPVQGRVVSAFGSNVGGKANNGIDISVPQGTAIKSAENGVVIYAGDGLKEFGKTVLVRHGDGLVTVYGHMSSISVARGDNVSRGQTVGTSGMTGSAKQPQLHFEVRKNTTPVNPTTYLN